MLDLAVDDLLRRSLAEDLASAGDLTSEATLPADLQVRADVVARRPGTIAGLPFSLRAFGLVDSAISAQPLIDDGQAAPEGTVLARVAGPARGILTAERTVLNLLGHLSGIATATAGLVRAVEGTQARIADTRKTTPGLRAVEKYAVRMGGGSNHRFGLYDAVLVKDNHIAAAGGIGPALGKVRDRVGHLVKVEVEVTTLDQLAEVLEAGADVVLLDNMNTATMAEAVRIVDGRIVVEASGGITPETVRGVAETGVDLISVGWITHSAPRLDVALDVR